MAAQARDTVINILDGIKDNLVLQEEAADSSPAAAATPLVTVNGQVGILE